MALNSTVLNSMEDCVNAGVAAFEKLEVRLRKAQEDALALVPIFEAANGLGMMGSLEAKAMAAEAKAIAGLAASAEAHAWNIHKQATAIAMRMNVDVPTIEGGGGR